MRICGQEISSEVIERIGRTLDAGPRISRRNLSRQVCEWLDWRGPSGKLQDGSCRKLLLELDRRAVIRLPEVEPKHRFPTNVITKTHELPTIMEFECNLHELGKVILIPVLNRRSKEARIWKAFMEEFHYLGSGPLCGAQIRYLVRSAKMGWLGALSFSSAVKRLKKRDPNPRPNLHCSNDLPIILFDYEQDL